MINLIGMAGERLFARLLPKASAAAFCRPQTYCEACLGYYLRRVWIFADCSVETGGCFSC